MVHLVPKMIQSFRIEKILGSKVVWRLLKVLLSRLALGYSPGELAQELNTSRASLSRALSVLQKEGLVVSRKIGGRKIYHVNSEKRLVYLIWPILMLERFENIFPRLRNTIELLFQQVREKVEVFIIFGSVSRGMYRDGSDIDICVVGKGVREKRFDFLPYRFEVHNYSYEDFKDLSDFVVLDAVMNGIVLKGEEFIYAILKNLKSFPKEYLLYRLDSAKRFITKSKDLSGEAKKYYENLAMVGLGEIESILKRRVLLGKREVRKMALIEEIEERLAKEGERIWLT